MGDLFCYDGSDEIETPIVIRSLGQPCLLIEGPESLGLGINDGVIAKLSRHDGSTCAPALAPNKKDVDPSYKAIAIYNNDLMEATSGVWAAIGKKPEGHQDFFDLIHRNSLYGYHAMGMAHSELTRKQYMTTLAEILDFKASQRPSRPGEIRDSYEFFNKNIGVMDRVLSGQCDFSKGDELDSLRTALSSSTYACSAYGVILRMSDRDLSDLCLFVGPCHPGDAAANLAHRAIVFWRTGIDGGYLMLMFAAAMQDISARSIMCDQFGDTVFGNSQRARSPFSRRVTHNDAALLMERTCRIIASVGSTSFR